VIVPVRDGERHLARVLAGVRAQGDAELIVIDSGSVDRSREIARAADADLIEVPPGEFGHGRTRNLGAGRSSGDLICFLTQDAIPLEGWLDAYREAFSLEGRVGAAFGPHLPHPDTSPMVARGLVEFFGALSPDGRPVIQRGGNPGDHFLSNVNACYARACWEEIRFRDIEYAEDQAFGKEMLSAGWLKVFHPGAAVLHAHDYGPIDFMRRHFDEFRGLRDALGHTVPIEPLRAARMVGAQIRGDSAWMRQRGWSRRRRAWWLVRSALHHAGGAVAAILGSRAERLPEPLQRGLSLEARKTGERAPR
jgi:glycosyltransferase involved in cell wall biosynthesis